MIFPCLILLQLLLSQLNGVNSCSFIVTNFNATKERVDKANYYIKFRGPDATNTKRINNWTFLHNLLSMTGAPTLQPFSDDSVVALFNGEVYNYLDLANELSDGVSEKQSNMSRSDGHVLIPAYRKWGQDFVKNLHGEFAIVLVDFKEEIVVVSTDVFSTKPLWYGSYDCDEPGTGDGKCFVAASYESGLKELGVPEGERHMADANKALVLSINDGFREMRHYPVFDFDLNQHKNTTDDWQEAFVKAVMVRTTGIKHRVFIGLSAGFDSGAIMLALEMLQKNLFAYNVKTKADSNDIIKQRIQFCQYAESTMIEVGGKQYQEEKKWLEERCEPYRYNQTGGQYGYKVYEDKASIGLSLILQQVRKRDGLIYLSGSGADETISDYAMNGRKIFDHSNFAGVFPKNLSDIFPWHSFYMGTQRDYLMKEELTGGVHGIETRYPFLDPHVVQEYLWLTSDVKNSEYKRPIADFLRSQNFPNMYGTKAGFSVKQGSDSSVTEQNVTNVNVSSLDNSTLLAKKIDYLRKNLTRTSLTRPNSSDTSHDDLNNQIYTKLISYGFASCWFVMGMISILFKKSKFFIR